MCRRRPRPGRGGAGRGGAYVRLPPHTRTVDRLSRAGVFDSAVLPASWLGGYAANEFVIEKETDVETHGEEE